MQRASWQSRYGDMAFNNQRVVVMNRLTSAAARKLGVRVVDAYAPSAAWFPNEVCVPRSYQDTMRCMQGERDGGMEDRKRYSSHTRYEAFRKAHAPTPGV